MSGVGGDGGVYVKYLAVAVELTQSAIRVSGGRHVGPD